MSSSYHFGRFHEQAEQQVSEFLREKTLDEKIEYSTVSVKVDQQAAAMLSVLAEFFGESRYSFAGAFLSDYIRDLFDALPENERLEVAKKADALYEKNLIDSGVNFKRGSSDHFEPGKFNYAEIGRPFWEGQHYFVVHHQKLRAESENKSEES